MGLGSALKAVLRLDNKQFNREAKKSTKEIAGVGSQAEKTSRGSTADFAKMGGAVAAIGTVAVGVILKIKEMGDQIAIEAERAARVAGGASRTLADEIGSEDIARVSQLFGQKPAEFNRFTAELGAQFDQSQSQVVAALEPIGNRIDDPVLRAAAIRTTLSLGRGVGGIFGEGAGLLAPLFIEQFGAETDADLRRLTGGVITAAAGSALPATAFGGIFTESAPSFPGISARELTGLTSGLGIFFPKKPERVGTVLQRIGQLSERKGPFLEGLLTDAGADPNTKNPTVIFESILTFIQNGGDLQQLQQEAQIPFEVLDTFKKAARGSFGIARAKGLRLFDKGAGDPGLLERELQSGLDTRASRSRRSELQGAIPTRSFGEPGSSVEAQEILQNLQAIQAGTISREDRLDFSTELNRAQQDQLASILPGVNEDPTFSDEEALILQANNALFPRVIKALDSVANTSEGSVARKARLKAAGLRNIKRSANRVNLRGNQKTEADKYNTAMRDAIQFLSQVVGGTVGPGRNPGGVVGLLGEGRSFESTEAQRAVVGESGILPAVVTNAQQVIILQNGSESRTQNNTNKATTQPSE